VAGLNGPCRAWHKGFATRAEALGYELILSLSYELLDQHCPEAWKQRAEDGTPALTGWIPPSALLSPAHSGAMSYLQEIAREFATVALDAGLPVRFQVGEPWWWVQADGRICLYDEAARAAFAPVGIADVRGALSAAQKATLDAAGAVLAGSTAALCAAVRQVAPAAETLLLVFLPSVLDGAEVKRANVPPGWAKPAFDVLQLEDYDWVTAGVAARPPAASRQWRNASATRSRSSITLPASCSAGGQTAMAGDRRSDRRAFVRESADVFVWALPQVLRDGFTWFGGDRPVDAFDDVRFRSRRVARRASSPLSRPRW
jgi:hypothetical protein